MYKMWHNTAAVYPTNSYVITVLHIMGEAGASFCSSWRWECYFALWKQEPEYLTNGKLNIHKSNLYISLIITGYSLKEMEWQSKKSVIKVQKA